MALIIPWGTACPRPKGFPTVMPQYTTLFVGVTQINSRQVLEQGSDLGDCQFGLGVGAYDLYLDLLGIVHHVVVGDDKAILIDDET